MSSDELIFQADRIHSVSIHNVTLVANQINEDGKTVDLVIEYQGKQHTLRAAHYVNESDVGKVGYVLPAHFASSAAGYGTMIFRAYQGEPQNSEKIVR